MLKKLRKVFVGIIWLTVLLGFAACKTKDNVETESNNKATQNNKFEFKYKEISDISSLSLMDIEELSSEYTGLELYDWGNNIKLPIPKPNNVSFISADPNALVIEGLNRENWIAYKEELSKKYIVVEYDPAHEDGFIGVWDKEYNFRIFISYYERNEYYEADGVMSLGFKLGCQEDMFDLSNKEVLDRALAELKLDNDGTAYCCNVSSRTNIIDGFSVYYIGPPKSVSDNAFMYLCVLKDGKIVFLEKNKVLWGRCNDQVEFLENDGKWKMFILAYSGVDELLYDGMPDAISTYEKENDKFVLKKKENVPDLVDKSLVTMRKSENEIDIHEVLIAWEEDEIHRMIPQWSVGEKIGVLK